MVTSRLFALALSALLLLSSVSASAIKVLPAPSLEQLAGAWIGPDDSIAYFRVEIDKSGRGLLVIQEDSHDRNLSLYKIKSTKLSGYLISFQLQPIKKADPTITLSGEASFGELQLIRRGVNHGNKWQNKLVLERENQLLPRIQAVKRAAHDFQSRAER